MSPFYIKPLFCRYSFIKYSIYLSLTNNSKHMAFPSTAYLQRWQWVRCSSEMLLRPVHQFVRLQEQCFKSQFAASSSWDILPTQAGDNLPSWTRINISTFTRYTISTSWNAIYNSSAITHALQTTPREVFNNCFSQICAIHFYVLKMKRWNVSILYRINISYTRNIQWTMKIIHNSLVR